MIVQQSEGSARTVRTQNYDALGMFPVRLSEGILPGPPEKKNSTGKISASLTERPPRTVRGEVTEAAP